MPRNKLLAVLEEAKKHIFGQDQMLESILAALICEGHLLIEGLPGLGKTMSVSVMSRLCDLGFNRIQFTPDLLPSDLIGTMIYSPRTEQFQTKFGPIFTQIVLADEINRSPAKVQSALLEAMAEKQVTIGEETHKLAKPFVVLATQNPIEQEGTYQLPEAQLDRFMMKLYVEYPSVESELHILNNDGVNLSSISKMFTSDDLISAQEQIDQIYVDDKLKKKVIQIIHATRPHCDGFDNRFKDVINFGASPRAALWLIKVGKFQAFLEGKDFVSPDNILKYVKDILGHRILLSYEASTDGNNPRDIAFKIAENIF